MKPVVNSTPLIALSMLNHLFVLKALFDKIFVPSSVYEEVVLKGGDRPGSQEVAKAGWIIVKEPAESFPLPTELLGLDTGEMDVILLAREVKADWVLIEKIARQGLQDLHDIILCLSFREKRNNKILLIRGLDLELLIMLP